MEIRQLRQRADTTANWLLVNPVLAGGEIGVEVDTGRYKIGNGVSDWAALGYARFDLSVSRNSTTVTVVATGDSAILPAATQSLAGVMSAADKTKLDGLSTTQGDVLAGGNTVFTGINAFLNNSGLLVGRGQSANDGIVIVGRAGGTASRRVTLIPAALSASRTLILPDNNGTVVTTGSVGTVTGSMLAPLTINDANISSNANIADSKLAAIGTPGKVANSATTATAANTAGAIVSRDGAGNFSAGIITAALSGNATTATRLETARAINGTSFNGTANITITAATPSSLTLSSSGNGAVAGTAFNGSAGVELSYNSIGAPSITGANASGTWAISISGNAATATAAAALQTGRTINGVVFNGTSNITITADTGSALAFNSSGAGAASGTTFNGSAARTISYNTIGAPSTAGVGASGTWGIGITGNAATATRLATARTINGVSFDGSGNITLTANTGAALTFDNAGGGAASGSTFNGSNAQTISYDTIGAPSTGGVGASGTWGIGITGNAATATRLATARTINGVSFDGSGNITLTANTGAALTFDNAGGGAASGSTFNGSTARTISYNTIGAPSITGDNASGTWAISINGTAAAVANGSIVNASVADNAGIAGSKILAAFGAQVVSGATFNATSLTDGGFQGIGSDSSGIPSFTWTNDLDTGMFRPGADRVGIAVGGIEVLRFDRLGSNIGTGRRLLSAGGLEIVTSGDNPLYLDSGNGNVFAVRLIGDTTSSGSNVFVDAATGRLRRSTSSIRYKGDVEDAPLAESEQVVYGSRAVQYSSLAAGDSPTKRHWGFIAEEAAINDSRLVEYANSQPENVDYGRYVVPIVRVMQEHKRVLGEVLQRLSALEAGG